jgi:hypothetical protein
MRENPPRIILTNINQLEFLMTRGRDLGMFEDAPLRFIVFDELDEAPQNAIDMAMERMAHSEFKEVLSSAIRPCRTLVLIKLGKKQTNGIGSCDVRSVVSTQTSSSVSLIACWKSMVRSYGHVPGAKQS